MKKIKLLTTLTIPTVGLTSLIIPMSSCSNNVDFVRESDNFEKKQDFVGKINYIFYLDSDSYTEKDIKVKLSGTDSNVFTATPIINGKTLVVEVKPVGYLEQDGATYTFNIDITIDGKTKSFTDLTATMTLLPTPDKYFDVEDTGTPGEIYVGCKDATNWNIRTLNIPQTINGNTVVGIKTGGFFDCTKIERVILPSTVKVIGENAFLCQHNKDPFIESSALCTGSIKSIEFVGESQLTEIKDNAFKGQKNLKSIILPKSLTKIGDSAFECVEYVYESSIDGSEPKPSLQWYDFRKQHWNCCGGLTNVIFEKGCQIASIPRNAFKGQKNLKSINIPSTVKYINTSAFECIDEVEESYYPIHVSDDYYTVSSSTCVGGLEDVIFDDNANDAATLYIYQKAFIGQKSLKTLSLPNRLDMLSDNAFACLNSKIIKDTTTGDTESHDNCVGGLETLEFGANTTVNKIPQSCFAGQKSLKSVFIPDAVESIETKAFSCVDVDTVDGYTTETCVGGLTNVTFGDNTQIAKIGGSAFYGQKALQAFDLPSNEKITTIEPYTFKCMDTITDLKTKEVIQETCVGNLKEFTFGSNLGVIDTEAFAGQGHLTTFGLDNQHGFYIPKTLLEIKPRAFYCLNRVYSDSTISFEPGNNDLEVLGGETKAEDLNLNSESFAGFGKLSTVNVSDNWKIDSTTFAGDINLENFVLTDTNTNYQVKQLYGRNVILQPKGKTDEIVCWPTASGDINFNDDAETGGILNFARCFYKNSNITSIRLFGTGATGEYSFGADIDAFHYCSNLKTINIGNLARFGNGTTERVNPFLGCYNLTKFEAPDDSAGTARQTSNLAITGNGRILINIVKRPYPEEQQGEKFLLCNLYNGEKVDFGDETTYKKITSISSHAFVTHQKINISSWGTTITELADSAFENNSFARNSIDMSKSSVKTIGKKALFNTGLIYLKLTSYQESPTGWSCGRKTIVTEETDTKLVAEYVTKTFSNYVWQGQW